jgi:carboxypeptidase T
LKNTLVVLISGFLFTLFSAAPQVAQTETQRAYILKLKAQDSFQRNLIANTGAAIDFVHSDYVVATAVLEEKNKLEKMGLIIEDLSSSSLNMLAFPSEDSKYHDYSELTQALQELHTKYPQITELKSAGRSFEGREIWAFVVRGEQDHNKEVPQAIFMGGHHAREHLSVDTPLRLLEWLLSEYQAGNSRIVELVNSREIHVIPAVNPDGLEFDISSTSYKLWRKNRTRNKDGSYGTDLNRNYSFGWGTGGSSKNPNSDTYMGTSPFSEPETLVIKNYVESLKSVKILLTFHTYSSLILYPWGHQNGKVANQKDYQTFVKMANKMAEWNGYTPEQASDLYIASGDTCDWAYGEHGIFAFTFELDPRDQWGGGGFYPGDEIIDSVVEKNKEPFLYLIDLADNPHRALNFGIGL